jgi:hypothetical protein
MEVGENVHLKDREADEKITSKGILDRMWGWKVEKTM